MASQVAKKGPSGKYHKIGLRQLRGLIEDFKDRPANERRDGKISFRDQAATICDTHIPAYHEPWRAAVREGAKIFGDSGEDYVAEALANLLAGEREARAKRKAKADAKANATPKSARPDSLSSRARLTEPPAVAAVPTMEAGLEPPSDTERT
jgi:hypothetical protein